MTCFPGALASSWVCSNSDLQAARPVPSHTSSSVVCCVSASRSALAHCLSLPCVLLFLLCPPPSCSVNSLFGFHWVSPGSCHQLGLQLSFLHWALNFLQGQLTWDLKDLKSGTAQPCWLLPPPPLPAVLWGCRRPETTADLHVPGPGHR